ncbi:carbamoyltransferase family protein [Nocardia wallacei]|uniref:carbamoyltransferase family protein n=1 Tax=Nocardia wallacei TaxID=480035 RepID=UPI002456A22A|nr:carbamoyltransferase C-terminal domain-containing protein [Nocardia wallacei]
MLSENTIGVNLTHTTDGIDLDDGAAALLEDGQVTVAIAEERVVRRKHAGGVGNAVRYCLAARGLTLADIDTVAVSICCDVSPDPDFALRQLKSEGLAIHEDQLLVVASHHLSHAASAFYPSPFDEALVIVADNEGTVLGERQHPHYWRNSLERTSIYLGRDKELQLLRRYADQPGQLGFGAAYNHFTKWLGFRSHHDAGQTMALAAYGTGQYEKTTVFSSAADGFVCHLRPLPQGGSPDVGGPLDEFDLEAARFLQAESVRDLIREQTGIDIGPGRSSCHDPTSEQFEIAWLIQSQLQHSLAELVRTTVAETGIRRVCLAGGVALNCVANTVIANLEEVDELYIQPAASDVGQCIGNALWAHNRQPTGRRAWRMPTCSLGRAYTDTEIDTAVRRWSDRVTGEPIGDPAACGARLLTEQAIIGWFDSGSEFGPRGLGRRSILADPRSHSAKERLDTVHKLRAPFRPYAPSVLAHQVAAWFSIDGKLNRTASQAMTTMLVAPTVRPEKRRLVPAITFVDGTARLQAVTQHENPRYYRLIQEFHEITGVPIVLNTSFNAGGDPIVETPDDAIESMLKMRLDALIIGHHLIRTR